MKKKILLVEDFDNWINLLSHLIKKRFSKAEYDLFVAKNFNEAERLFKRYQSEIFIVFSDIKIPENEEGDIFIELGKIIIKKSLGAGINTVCIDRGKYGLSGELARKARHLYQYLGKEHDNFLERFRNLEFIEFGIDKNMGMKIR